MSGLERIQAERQRVIQKEGYTPTTDRIYKIGELYKAAQCYEQVGTQATTRTGREYLKDWPWEWHFFKPSNGLRDLEKAGQLYMAEIDRLDFLISETFSPILAGHYKERRERAAEGLERCVKALDEMEKVTG